MVAIRPLTVEQLEQDPHWPDLLREYAAGSALEGLPKPNPNMGMYKQLEAAGMYRLFGAWKGDELVGFVSFLLNELPHYSVRVATSESFFVAGAHRKTGAGLKLLRHAEEQAKQLGAQAMFFSAIVGGRYDQLLHGMGMKQATRVYFRSLE